MLQDHLALGFLVAVDHGLDPLLEILQQPCFIDPERLKRTPLTLV